MEKEKWSALFQEVLELLAAGRQDEAEARIAAEKRLSNLPAAEQDKQTLEEIAQHYKLYLDGRESEEFVYRRVQECETSYKKLTKQVRRWWYRFFPARRRKLEATRRSVAAELEQLREEVCAPSAPSHFLAYQKAHELFEEIIPFEGTKTEEIANISLLSNSPDGGA